MITPRLRLFDPSGTPAADPVAVDLLRTFRLLVRALLQTRPAPAPRQDLHEDDNGPGPDPDPVKPSPTNPTRQSILDVLAQAERPLKQAAIARRAGRRYGPYFRTCCASLRQDGLIVETPDGWWPVSRLEAGDAPGTTETA
jgi:hypothetical protein